MHIGVICYATRTKGHFIVVRWMLGHANVQTLQHTTVTVLSTQSQCTEIFYRICATCYMLDNIMRFSLYEWYMHKHKAYCYNKDTQVIYYFNLDLF